MEVSRSPFLGNWTTITLKMQRLVPEVRSVIPVVDYYVRDGSIPVEIRARDSNGRLVRALPYTLSLSTQPKPPATEAYRTLVEQTQTDFWVRAEPGSGSITWSHHVQERWPEN